MEIQETPFVKELAANGRFCIFFTSFLFSFFKSAGVCGKIREIWLDA